MILAIQKLKKLIILPVLLLAFALPFFVSSQNAFAAPQKKDCGNNKKCEQAFEKCNNNKCRQDVLDKYKPAASSGLSGSGAQASSAQPVEGGKQCGNNSDSSKNVITKFNFGCLGKKGPENLSAILDITYAIIRFLSIGIGIIVTISIILAGIQYATSEGNPETTQKAKLRIQNALIGLLIYIFAFSLLQFLIPGGLFRPGVWISEPIPLNWIGLLL